MFMNTQPMAIIISNLVLLYPWAQPYSFFLQEKLEFERPKRMDWCTMLQQPWPGLLINLINFMHSLRVAQARPRAARISMTRVPMALPRLPHCARVLLSSGKLEKLICLASTLAILASNIMNLAIPTKRMVQFLRYQIAKYSRG